MRVKPLRSGVPNAVLWLARLQGTALAGLGVAVIALAATSTTSLSAGFVVVEVLLCVFGAWLFGYAARWRRARAPILLLEIIAVLISGQLLRDGRVVVGLVVGLPALAASVGILLAAREDG